MKNVLSTTSDWTLYISNTEHFLKYDGYWYTYATLTSYPWGFCRRDALWLIWIARQRTLHVEGRSLIQRLVDSTFG